MFCRTNYIFLAGTSFRFSFKTEPSCKIQLGRFLTCTGLPGTLASLLTGHIQELHKYSTYLKHLTSFYQAVYFKTLPHIFLLNPTKHRFNSSSPGTLIFSQVKSRLTQSTCFVHKTVHNLVAV